MTKPPKNVSRLLDGLARAIILASATGLVAMTALIAWQVFARFVLNASPAWTESFALLLMLYFVLLAAAVGVREGFHLGVRIILDNVSLRARRIMLGLVDVVVAFFGVAMIVNGVKLATFTADHIIPTLGVTRAAAYWPFQVCGVLIVLFSLERIARGNTTFQEGSSSN